MAARRGGGRPPYRLWGGQGPDVHHAPWRSIKIRLEERRHRLAKRYDQESVQALGAEPGDPFHRPERPRGTDAVRQDRGDVPQGGSPHPIDPSIPSVSHRLPTPPAWSQSPSTASGGGVHVASVTTPRRLSHSTRVARSARSSNSRRPSTSCSPLHLPGRRSRRRTRDRCLARGGRCAHLEVILETATGQLRRSGGVDAGHDGQRRTSSDVDGQIGTGASLPSALCMMEAARDFHRRTVSRSASRSPATSAPQAVDPVPDDPVRDARRELDDARPVPDRRVHVVERRVDADRQGTHRPLSGPRLLHGGLA